MLSLCGSQLSHLYYRWFTHALWVWQSAKPFVLPLVHTRSLGVAVSEAICITVGSHMLFGCGSHLSHLYNRWFTHMLFSCGSQLSHLYYCWFTHPLLVWQSAKPFVLPLVHTCSLGVAVS